MTNLDLVTYKSLYLKTAREHVNDLKKNLALLNSNPTDKQPIYEVFRLFHSLKSQNYFMGFEKTAQLCKVFEQFFRDINDGKKIYNPNLSDLILRALKKLEDSFIAIEQSNRELDLTQDIINLETKLSFNMSS